MRAWGYRIRLERDGDRVRLITRGGCKWSDRYRAQEPAPAVRDRRRSSGARCRWRVGLQHLSFSRARLGLIADLA